MNTHLDDERKAEIADDREEMLSESTSADESHCDNGTPRVETTALTSSKCAKTRPVGTPAYAKDMYERNQEVVKSGTKKKGDATVRDEHRLQESHAVQLKALLITVFPGRVANTKVENTNGDCVAPADRTCQVRHDDTGYAKCYR